MSFLFDLLLGSFWPLLVNLLLIASLSIFIATYFADKMPILSLKTNVEVARVLSGLIFLFAIYCKGFLSASDVWREKVNEYKEQVKTLETKSQEKNIEIQEKIIEKVRVVKDVQYVIQEKLVEVEKIIDAECKVLPEAIEIHNAAAKNRKPNE